MARVATSAELQAALAGADPTIELAAGTYTGCLVIGRSVRLVAAADTTDSSVILDADRSGSVVMVDEDGINLELVGLTLTGGKAETGGAVLLGAFSEVLLDRCVLVGNRCPDGPGGALWADAGTATLVGCEIADNQAQKLPALAILGVATVALRDCVVAAGPASACLVSVHDGGELHIEQSRITAESGTAIRVSGTSSRRPTVVITASTVRGAVSLDLRSRFAGHTTVADSTLVGEVHGIYRPIGQVDAVT